MGKSQAYCFRGLEEHLYIIFFSAEDRVHCCPFSLDVVAVVAFCQPNDPTGQAGTGVGVLGHVVFFSVDHHGSADDGVLANQADHFILDVHLGAAAMSLHIAEIASMPGALLGGGPAVIGAVRVEVGACTGE